MTVDLLITTYNRPDALEAVLVSVLQQTQLPQQVIVADDGSGEATAAIIRHYQALFPVELLHAWQEDSGFRAAASRNRGLALVKSSYVIIIDGDMLLDPHFIADHLYFAQPGQFIQGGRTMLTEEKTKALLAHPEQPQAFRFLEPGVEFRLEKKLTAFRSLNLAKWTLKELRNKRKVRSCNMSFYMEDVRKVNGFNNEFVGWGREDSEFVERLNHAGVKGNLLKFAALGYHLYHKEETRAALPQNDKLLQETIDQRLVACNHGLADFLN